MALSAADRPCLAQHSSPSLSSQRQLRALHAPPCQPHARRQGRSSMERPSRRVSIVTAAGRGGNDKLRDSEMVDYWAVLGLERGAGPDNVKAAYRRLQKTYHPDSPMVRTWMPPAWQDLAGVCTHASPGIQLDTQFTAGG